jgi:hypothetical protein
MKNLRFTFIFLLVGGLLFPGCEGDHHDHDHDQELITTVTLTFTPQGGGTALTTTWKDLDGDGGAAPTVTPIQLVRGTTYNVTVTLLNESETPAKDLTEEIRTEGDVHQFFYTVTPAGNMTITVTDRDVNNRPIGLTFTAQVSATAQATVNLNVKLFHFERASQKTGTSISNETDINIDFPITTVPGN